MWSTSTVPVRMLCACAQAPHVRCSQAAAAVGDDVFFFGGSYYKCAFDFILDIAAAVGWVDCTCAKCTFPQMLGLRVKAGYIELSPLSAKLQRLCLCREDQSGLQPLADTFVLDSKASCWQARAPRS